MESVNMLIDFNSPVHKKELSVPLIPVPPQIELLPKEMCEPCIDPFEVQDAPDPFEDVLQNAVNNEQSEVDLGPNSNSKQCKTAEPKVSTDSKTENPIFHKEGENKVLENPGINEDPASCLPQDDLLNKPLLENDQALSMNTTIPDCKVDFENSHNTTSVHNNTHTLKDSLKSVSVAENENRSQTSADFSTEESIKAVIARRVNRCIQDTLNGSIKTNKNVDDSLFKKPQNRRSLSFIGLSSASVKKECNRLNKSCIDVNDSFDLENQKLDASGKLIDASSDSSGFGLLSPNTTNASAEGDGEDQVFKEAHRISRTFSKLAESFRQEQASDSDDEDLLSCKPRWLYTDSSEDEEEKLLKDPALNFRRRSNDSALSSSAATVAPPNGNVPDSPALLAYKSRRSFTNLQAAHNTQEELTLKRSISIGSKLKEVPVIPTLAASGPVNLLKSNDQPLKLRKHATGDVKRGPLRAVMPIQSMTKDPLPVTGKISLKQDTSPEARSHKTVYAIGTPIKDNSQLNMIPMASSTPNKDESFASSKANTNSLLKPTMLVVANKRHSLEGSFGSHKSRDAVSEAGARPRSNSVNSSIPRVMQVKPLRGLPLAPKSTSSLTRVANTNINANNVSKLSEKKNASHQKTNVKKARVLAEVKTKSPLQSKVRTAVNAISGLVRGKKTAARDKENRFPA